MAGRIDRRAGFAGMGLVSLVLAHNLVFVVVYRGQYAAALEAAGHGTAWNTAVALVLGLGTGLLAAAAWRLHRLGILARGVALDEFRDRLDLAALWRHLVPLWRRLSLVTTFLFVLQENAERFGAGAPPLGLGVLDTVGGPVALPIIVAVSFLVALVAALFLWRRDLLVSRIAANRLRPPGRAAVVRGTAPLNVDRRPGSLLGHGFAVRAPPAVFDQV